MRVCKGRNSARLYVCHVYFDTVTLLSLDYGYFAHVYEEVAAYISYLHVSQRQHRHFAAVIRRQ